MLGITGGGRRATTRLLDAEFPRFRQLLPAEHTSAAVSRSPRSSRRSSASRWWPTASPRCGWSSATDGLRLAAGGDDVGSAEEELPCELDGEPLTIAFNPGYLLDGLGALHTERAQLSFTTPNRPALVRPGAAPPAEAADGRPAPETRPTPGPGYLHLLMPVRLPG